MSEDTGYYSLVTIGLNEQDSNDKLFLKVDPRVKISSIADVTYYEYSWLKWYNTGYEPIQNILDYLNKLGSTNFGFIRVGEMSDDITRHGNPHEFNMCVTTRIIIPPEHSIKSTSIDNEQ